MLDYARPQPGEATDRVFVKVTFLRMDRKPDAPTPRFPEGFTLTKEKLEVAAYRDIYARVGQKWLWWLRRMMPDDMLARLLADPAIAIYVLRDRGAPAGFFELDATPWPDVNLSYFGLVPSYIGKGLGMALLHSAVEQVFAGPVRGMTVNTCTADHPQALPNYKRAGFRVIREIHETWNIPRRLGFEI